MGDYITGNVNKSVRPYVVNIDYSTDRIYMNPQSSVTLRANGGGNGANTGLYCLPDKAAVPVLSDTSDISISIP
jgi:hypothetical protein